MENKIYGLVFAYAVSCVDIVIVFIYSILTLPSDEILFNVLIFPAIIWFSAFLFLAMFTFLRRHSFAEKLF